MPLPPPEPNALPLPAPVALFSVLLHATLVLHLVAMNVLLGGAILALVERLRGRAGDAALARRFEKVLPVAMALTVTLGVAPLLFLQTVYGALFYRSSVLMAWPWFSVVLFLLGTYSLTYVASFRAESGRGGAWVNAAVVAGLLAIAFIYVNNMTLALRPEVWTARYAARPGGTSLNLDDPTVAPRLLHFVVAAVAVAGMVVALWGARRVEQGEEEGRDWLRKGARWFGVATAIQIGTGGWWLLALERRALLPLMGGEVVTSLVFGGSILLSFAAVAMLATATRAPRPAGRVHGAATLLILTIAGMVIARQAVREGMLGDRFRPEALPVASQWDVFAIFAILLVAALAVVAWLVRSLASSSSQAPGEGPAPSASG